MARPEIWAAHFACRKAALLYSGKPYRKAWEAHARGGIPHAGRSGLTALREAHVSFGHLNRRAWEAKPTSNAGARAEAPQRSAVSSRLPSSFSPWPFSDFRIWHLEFSLRLCAAAGIYETASKDAPFCP
jgi:hypothetical protein